MSAIEIIVPRIGFRKWHQLVIDRLAEDGHEMLVVHGDARSWPPAVVPLLELERRIFRRFPGGLGSPASLPSETTTGSRPRLRLDLIGTYKSADAVPTLRLRFDGDERDMAVPMALAAGRLPDIEAVLDGDRLVARAAPMIDKPESTALGTDDVLARAATLARLGVARVLAGETGEVLAAPGDDVSRSSAGFLSAYVGSALPRLGRESLRRLRYRQAHWRVGYRYIDGPGVAETGRLGKGWRQAPDPGDRFYADPFPHCRPEGDFIFVEDYPHATGKGVISVMRVEENGQVHPAQPVLEEPFHLSYPQVFDWRGETWMLPEASASRRLTLYRAARYPDRWEAAAVLLEGREISDATLLEHAGSWWLFATERDGFGSTSDTMAVFSAPALDGPWTPHPMNPIVIDRRLARPGGAFVRVGKRILLPVQDGTEGYGGGLGLSELLALDAGTVRLSDPAPISAAGDWPHPRIHTLNRVGRLEVIDGIVAARRGTVSSRP